MIEEKINNSLKELEQGLRDIESARKQVEKTVSSYDGLTKTTGDYVTKLGSITELKTKLKYSLIINAVSLAAIIAIVILLLK